MARSAEEKFFGSLGVNDPPPLVRGRVLCLAGRGFLSLLRKTNTHLYTLGREGVQWLEKGCCLRGPPPGDGVKFSFLSNALVVSLLMRKF